MQKENRPESLRVDHFRFLPLTDPRLNITDVLLVGYNGAFAQRLEMNRARIQSFARATPDLPIVLQDQPYFPLREKPEESGGATAWSNRGTLFEYVSPQQRREESCYQVEPIDGKPGWNIRLNGGKMRQDLIDDGIPINSPEMVSRFANRMNFCFRQALVETIIRDKLTFARQDIPPLVAKYIHVTASAAFLAYCARDLDYLNPKIAVAQIGIILAMEAGGNTMLNSVLNHDIKDMKDKRQAWGKTLPSLPLEDVARGIWEAYRPGKFIRPIQKKSVY